MSNSKKNDVSRRTALKQMLATGLGTTAGLAAYNSLEEKCLAAHLAQEEHLAGDETVSFLSSEENIKHEVDGVTGATRTSFELPQLETLKEKLPMSQIGNVKISRMILGGNLLTGFVHSRDLIYVGDLARRYNTKNKVFETFYLAEECGMNTFLAYPGVLEMVKDYWKLTDGKIQYICDSRSPEQVQKAIDAGAVACYINGERSDQLAADEKFDYVAECLETARKNGVPAGIGAHRIATCQKIAAKGINPDFWMKTYHHHDYWSIENPSENDNVYCRDPEATREFMASRKEPWIAFKVCAAGAIHPAQGMQYAFEGGADFVCVGMYDFQLVTNVNICTGLLQSQLNRTRPWQSPTLAPEEEEEDEDA